MTAIEPDARFYAPVVIDGGHQASLDADKATPACGARVCSHAGTPVSAPLETRRRRCARACPRCAVGTGSATIGATLCTLSRSGSHQPRSGPTTRARIGAWTISRSCCGNCAATRKSRMPGAARAVRHRSGHAQRRRGRADASVRDRRRGARLGTRQTRATRVRRAGSPRRSIPIPVSLAWPESSLAT